MLMTLALLLGLNDPVPPAAVSPDGFRSWFDAELKQPLPKGVAARAREFRYVLVGGMRGESMRGYFSQNAQELRACGVPRRAIHFVTPSSRRTVAENAEAVASDFGAIAASGPERLVVIAHSRGACDVLAFALSHPDFVADRVEAMFLVQGPFGGTGLADYVVGDGPPVDSRLRPWPRFLARVAGKFEHFLMTNGRHAGIAGLTREASHAYWAGLLDEHPDAVSVVGPKVFYVEAETRPSRLRMLFRTTASYLTLHYGPNDGVVARGDQSLPWVGTSLGVYDAGHSDFTRKGAASRAGKRARRAFTRAVLMAVGRSPD